MAKEVQIKDKNKSKNKVVIFLLLGLLVLFILVRVIAVRANGDGGVQVIQPDLDSVNLENNTSKMAQFEKEHQEELEKQYTYNSNENSPKNYDFKKMFEVEKSNSNTQQNESVKEEKTVTKNENSYGRYSPVETKNNSENISSDEIEVIRRKRQNQAQQPVEVKEPVQEQIVEQKVSSPFGTYSSTRGKQNQNSIVSTSGKVKDAYKCFLHSDQRIANGGAAIFRAAEDIVLETRTIKKNSLMYGVATYQGKRVMIRINRVKSVDGEYPVSLNVYDNDFVKGIFFKNAYDEVAEKTTDDAANQNNINPGNGIIGTATKAVVSAGKNVSDAIKKERSLNIQDGYIIYIKEEKQ